MFQKRRPCGKKMYLTKPDRGWAWAVMMASFGMGIINGFLVFGYGMLQVVILERFEDGVAKASMVGSLFTTFLSVTGIIGGLIIKRYSCRVALMTGSLVMTSGIFISAFMPTLDWIILTYGVIGGVGGGIEYASIYVALGYNFEKNLNIATGFAFSGCGIGPLVLTPLFAYLMNIYSLESLFIFLAVISSQAVIFSFMVFPSELERKQNSLDRETQPEFRTICFPYIECFKSKSFSLLLIGLFLSNFGAYIVYFHFPNYVIMKGNTDMQTSLLVSITGLCCGVSRILAGWLCNSKALDEATLLAGTSALCAIFTLALPVSSQSFIGQVVFSVVFGLYSSCFIGLLNCISLRYTSLEYLHTAVAVGLVAIGCGIMTGPPSAGLIIDKTGIFDTAFIIAGLSLLGAAVFYLLAEWWNRIVVTRDGQHRPEKSDSYGNDTEEREDLCKLDKSKRNGNDSEECVDLCIPDKPDSNRNGSEERVDLCKLDTSESNIEC